MKIGSAFFIAVLFFPLCAHGLESTGPLLIWKEVPGAVSYHVEISVDKTFTQIILNEKSQKRFFQWTNAKPGTYYWHVQGIDVDGQLGEISVPSILKVSVPPLIIAEKLKTVKVPQSKVAEPTEIIELHWKGSLYAKTYEIEISGDPSFSHPLIVTTNKPMLIKELPSSAPLVWRVRPLDENGEGISQFSEVGIVRFQKNSRTFNFLEADAYVEPQTDDFLLINGKRFYLETVSVKQLLDRKKDSILAIRVSGVQSWNRKELVATSRCFGTEDFDNLISTGMEDAWVLTKTKCLSRKIQLCLSEADGKQACSGWLNMDFSKAVMTSSKTPFDLKPFSWKGPVPLYWTGADGRSMQIVWDPSLAKDPETSQNFTPPKWFASGLLGAVRVQTENPSGATQSYIHYLGSFQLVYWPEASPNSDLSFTPQRLGGQFRYSASLSPIALASGQTLSLSWADAAINYRLEPGNVFEGQHVYGILMDSSYNAIGTTMNRFGGGLGFSSNLPKSIFGLTYTGRIYTYLDAVAMPLDLTQDGLGPIFDAKINAVWLFKSGWFATADIEGRFLNFAMDSVYSVFRIQFGGGFAF